MPPTKELQLDACDATAGWTGIYDAIQMTLNTTGETEGTGCLNLGISGAINTAYTWGEYYKSFTSQDLSSYDYLKFKLYVENTATIAGINNILVDFVCDSAYDDYYNWNIEQADLTTGWNTVTKYFNAPYAIYGTPSRATFQKFTLSIRNNADVTLGYLMLDDVKVGQTVETQYDIKLDSQGYLLKEGSYNMTDLPYLIDRFSSGDISYSDFNFWQYKAQTDWSGGFNEKYFSEITNNKFYDGEYLDISKMGELKISPKMSFVTAMATTGTITAIGSFNGSAVIANQNEYIYTWPGTGYAAVQSTAFVGDGSITDIFNFDTKLYLGVTEDPVGTLIQGRAGAVSAIDWSAITSQPSIFYTNLGDTMYGNYIYSYNATLSSITEIGFNGEPRELKTWRSKFYFLLNDAQRYENTHTCGLYSYDGVDLLSIQDFVGQAKASLESFNNKLWFVISGILYSYDGEKISTELDILDKYYYYSLDAYHYPGDDIDFGTYTLRGVQKAGNKLYLLCNDTSATTQILCGNQYGGWSHIAEHTAVITALGTLDSLTTEKLLIGDAGGNLFYLDDAAYDTSKTSWIESSWIDMDFFSVDKLFKSISVYCEALPLGCSFAVYYKIDNGSSWTSIGGSDIENEIFLECNLPSGTCGKKIKYKIEMTTIDSTKTPTITDVVIKYIVAPDTKKKWSVGILLTNELILDDTTRETKTGKKLKEKLWESRLKKNIVEFQDVDGSKYNVLINDVQIEGPFIQKGRSGQGTGPEYVATLELIEA